MNRGSLTDNIQGFLLLQDIEVASGVHPASCSMGTGVSVIVDKAARE